MEKQRKRPEPGLAQAQQQVIEGIMASAGDAIYGIDTNGCCLFVNPAGARMFGYTVPELLGQNMHTVLHHSYPDGRPFPASDCPIYASFTDGLWHHGDELFWHRDGSPIAVSYTSTPTREGDRLTGAFVMVRDCRERKQRDAQLAEQTRLLNLTNDAIIVRDAEDRIQYWNHGAETLYGWRPEETVGQNIHTLLRTTFPEPLDQMTATLHRELRWEGELVHTARDGRRLSILSRWAMDRTDTGETRAILETNTDITERKEVQRHLQGIAWLLKRNQADPLPMGQPYGDLTELNRDRLVLDSVGKPLLAEVAQDYVSLLGTSGAVYERNGDYALGMFTSHWCRFMDQASRTQCEASDNRAALENGQWHCHESCWAASRRSMEMRQPVDIECKGGIRLYAVPIQAGDEVVGSINFGYGDPPKDLERLTELGDRYGTSVETLHALSDQYESRPAFLIEVAKQRLHSSAKLLGEIVKRKQAEAALRASKAKIKAFAEQLEELVTERTKELVQSEQRLALATKAGLSGTFDWDAVTNTNLWSDQLLALYGLTRPEFGGRYEDWLESLVPEDRDITAAAVKGAFETGYFEADFRIRRRSDHAVRWIHGRGEVFHDSRGKPLRMVGINIDITDRKAVEEELRESQTRLRTLATELNLAEQRERKRLATELHDHLQQLLVLGKLKLGQGQRAASSLASCGDTMRQVDDLLSDALQYTRTLVAELSPPALREHGLSAGLSWLGEYMRGHHLSVTVTVPDNEVPVPEDQALLMFQSVRELLINTAKHAAINHATVTMTCTETQLDVMVSDQGAGFDAASATAIEATKESLSSKFGLFSIRERMKALGGTFDLHSSPGRGTSATLTLPLKPRAETFRPARETVSSSHPRRTSQSSTPLAGTKYRVLLVDDHAMVRQGLRAVLTSFPDIELVGEAANGEDAIALVDTLRPSVVIMDINMPKMNGIEATKRIKARYPEICIIGLSVNANDENQARMRSAGAALLLTKEAAVDELYHVIERQLTADAS